MDTLVVVLLLFVKLCELHSFALWYPYLCLFEMKSQYIEVKVLCASSCILSLPPSLSVTASTHSHSGPTYISLLLQSYFYIMQ